MKDTTSNAFHAAVLAQFLRECEPPTPPASAPAFPFPDFTTSITSSGVFELEKEDKDAILEALDAYTGRFESNDALEGGFGPADVDEPIVRRSETPKAHKLRRERTKANERRTRHRLRVKEEWNTLKLQRAQLTAKLKVLTSSHILSGACVNTFDWQSQALNEREARLEAEGQQRELQSAIERSTAVIKQLQDLLDRQNFASRPQRRGGKSLRRGGQHFHTEQFSV